MLDSGGCGPLPSAGVWPACPAGCPFRSYLPERVSAPGEVLTYLSTVW